MVDPCFPPSSTFHYLDPIEKNLECFCNYMEPEVETHSLILQYDINTHNFNLELDLIESIISSRDTLQPIPSISHDSLFHDPLDQSTSNSLGFQRVVSSSNREQGSFISCVEEKSVEDMSYLSSLFQDDNLTFLANH